MNYGFFENTSIPQQYQLPQQQPHLNQHINQQQQQQNQNKNKNKNKNNDSKIQTTVQNQPATPKKLTEEEILERSIFVAGLKFTWEKSKVASIFRFFGKINSVILIDKKGCAIIQFNKPEFATEAISMMDGKEVDGRTLNVVKQKPRVISKDKKSSKASLVDQSSNTTVLESIASPLEVLQVEKDNNPIEFEIKNLGELKDLLVETQAKKEDIAFQFSDSEESENEKSKEIEKMILKIVDEVLFTEDQVTRDGLVEEVLVSESQEENKHDTNVNQSIVESEPIGEQIVETTSFLLEERKNALVETKEIMVSQEDVESQGDQGTGSIEEITKASSDKKEDEIKNCGIINSDEDFNYQTKPFRYGSKPHFVQSGLISLLGPKANANIDAFKNQNNSGVFDFFKSKSKVLFGSTALLSFSYCAYTFYK